MESTTKSHVVPSNVFCYHVTLKKTDENDHVSSVVVPSGRRNKNWRGWISGV